jgi:cytochrome c oxidase subunit 2
MGLGLPVPGGGPPLSYLVSHGPRADPVTPLTWGLLIISIAVVVIIGALVLGGSLGHRTSSQHGPIRRAPLAATGGGLGWLWWGVGISCVPLAVALVWTVAVLAAVDKPRTAPALTIEVTGLQWWWRVRYLNPDPSQVFETANEIHIPVGQPVRVRLIGGDVIHSFWVPQLAGKTDTIPGQTNVTWLQANVPGRYAGQCTEYCGLQHAHMAAFVIADPPEVFEAWRERQLQAAAPAGAGPPAVGEALFVQRCGACHTVRGSAARGVAGPDLTHLMSRATLAAGAVPNTVSGLAGWIANPQALKPGARMPATGLSGRELGQVSAYLETLQ